MSPLFILNCFRKIPRDFIGSPLLSAEETEVKMHAGNERNTKQCTTNSLQNTCEIMNNLLEKQPQLVFASNSLVKASS